MKVGWKNEKLDGLLRGLLNLAGISKRLKAETKAKQTRYGENFIDLNLNITNKSFNFSLFAKQCNFNYPRVSKFITSIHVFQTIIITVAYSSRCSHWPFNMLSIFCNFTKEFIYWFICWSGMSVLFSWKPTISFTSDVALHCHKFSTPKGFNFNHR